MRRMSARASCLVALVLNCVTVGCGRDDGPPPPPADVPVASNTHALLVGCTEYPELEQVSEPEVYASTIRLLGPANDATLMQSVLHRYLGVPEANIRVLAGWPDDPAERPTRANILGHLDRLADEVAEGSHVLFLFAGHGSQQPDAEGGDEADGRDEILLPADAGRWDPELQGVANVITDDEIRGRLVALRDTGAAVWALFDCCHSGTMMRGVPEAPSLDEPFEGVRDRSLPPTLLGVPTSRGAGSGAVGGVLGPEEGSLHGIAAIYAARSWEQAPEMVLPRSRSAPDRLSHGLCTFQVARTLQHYGGGLTIAEVFEHVRGAYAALPWSEAAPLAEGDLSQRVLPGSGGVGAALLLRRDGDRLLLDAGALRGLTVGSVLEVYRPGAFRDPAGRLGRVTLTDVEALCATCGALPDGPDPAQIPAGAPAEVVEVAPGGPPLRLALVDVAGRALPEAARQPLRERLLPDARVRANFPFVAPAEADWFLRDLPLASDRVARFLLSPAAADHDLEPLIVVADEFASVVERMRRATDLRRLARGALAQAPEGLAVEVRLRTFGSETPVPLRPGTSVLPGDQILLRIVNGTGRDVDVAIKNLDAAQREFHVWPPGEPSRRLSRLDTRGVVLDDLELTDDGLGRESLLVVLSVRTRGSAALDLGVLTERQGERTLLDVLEPEGVLTRGVDDTVSDSAAITELSWISTWGRMRVRAGLHARLEELAGPVAGNWSPEGGEALPAGEASWLRALVVPGDEETADVLVLSGVSSGGAEGALAILVDEDGDAGLRSMNPTKAAVRAVSDDLPVELRIVAHAGRAWAAYPQRPGDVRLDRIRVRSESADRAERLLERRGDVWESRETRGPWLSTTFVPLDDADAADRRRRIVRALRQVLETP